MSAGLRAWLIEQVADALGVAATAVDPTCPLRESGLSSRELTVLGADLGRRVGAVLAPDAVWRHPTIDALAAAFGGGGADTAGAAGAVAERASGPARDEPVAVVGLGCRFPGGGSADTEGPAAFWDLLRDGGDATGPAPAGRFDSFASGPPESVADRAGYLADAAGFDAGFFGIMPREAATMDPQQRLLLEVTWAALEHAGIPPVSLRGTRTGVFVGLSATEYGLLTMTDPAAVTPWTSTGVSAAVAANRLSYLLDLRGPSLTIDTACSSSLVALHQAVRSLAAGESDLALVGGVNLLLSPATTATFAQAGALSPGGRCTPFAQGADGIARGEGCGVVVLKPLSAARRDGDRVLALVRGSAVNSDGRSNGMTAPNPQAQEELLRAACTAAGLEPRSLDYVEAHGTGTPLGDPIEAGALGRVLGAGRADDRPLLLGSAKANLGHLEGAAGIAGFAKLVLAMVADELPPTPLHGRTASDLSGLGMSLVTQRRPWPRYSGVARAGVSAFGFGGTNAHVVLEEWPGARATAGAGGGGTHLVTLSARSAEGLRARAAALADLLTAGGPPLAGVASTLAVRREHLPVRAAVVAGSVDELVEDLRGIAAGAPGAGSAGTVAPDAPPPDGPVFVFSGHGSQWVGMGQELLGTEPAFAAAADELDPVFARVTGATLRAAMAAAGDGDLVADQLALLGHQLCTAALWAAHGVTPAAIVGHSVGEIAAAVVAGALDAATGLRVTMARARLLAEINAAGDGAMAVVEMSGAEVEALAPEFPGVVVAVYAAPDQCTVAGPVAAVAGLVSHVEGLGGLARRLAVGGAGHSAAVDPLLPRLRAELAGLTASAPRVPVYSTVHDDPREPCTFDVEHWVANVRRPVRFAPAMAAAFADGHGTVVEIAPHPVTLPAITRTAGGRAVVVASAHRKAGEKRTFLGGLAQLHVLGHPGIAAARYRGRVTPVELPPPSWVHQRFWPERPRTDRARTGGPGDHPLLGTHLELPGDEGHAWSGDLGGLPADETVPGRPVVSGAVLLDLVLAAAAFAPGTGPLEVADLRLPRQLAAGEHVPVTTRLSGSGPAVLGVHTRTPGGRWERCAVGRVARAQAPATHGEPAGPGEVSVPVPAAGAAGPGPGAVAPTPVAPTPVTTPVATAVIAALVEAGDAVGETAAGPVRLASAGRVLVLGDLQRAARAVATPAAGEPTPGRVRGHVRLLDAGDAVLAELTDVVLASVTRAELPVALPELLLTARWRPEPLPARNDTAVAATATGDRWAVVSGPGTAPGWLPEITATLDAGPDTTGATGVLFVAGAGDPGGPDTAQRTLIAVAGTVARLAELPAPPRLWLVATGLPGAPGPGTDPAGLDGAALRAAVRVLAFEHPELRATLVDVGPDGTGLVEELAAGSSGDIDDEICWRDGVRSVRRLERTYAPGETPVPVPSAGPGAYVITGGLGGLGLVTAEHLARHGATRLVLSGRRGPGPDADAVLARLRERGVDVQVVTGDVAAPGQAQRLVDAATRGGTALRGVLHGAGVLADGAAATLDATAVADVWWPKAWGAWRLHEATAGLDLDWWIVHSSAAALIGSPGQLAYAAANAWTDALVAHRRALGLPGAAVQWGAWGEVGGAGADAMRESLSTPDALEAFDAVLGAGWETTGVLRMDPGAVLSGFPSLARRPFLRELLGSAAVAPVAAHVPWRDLAPEQAAAVLDERVQALVAELMGIAPGRLDRTRPLTGLGLDSLVAMRARGVVEHDLGLSLPLPLLLRGASLDEVVAHLVEQAGLVAAPPTATGPKAGASVTDAPVTEAPVIEAPLREAPVIEPRDPAERWVARRWRDVLPGHRPGVHDPFPAEPGGAAQSLRDAVAAAFGPDAAGPELFAVPTVAGMADVLRDRIEGTGANPVRVLRADSHPGPDPHGGPESQGAGEPPLWLFHPAGGPTSVYHDLVRRLGGDHAVFGLDRLDGGAVDVAPDLWAVPDRARRYAELIREVTPHGPYRLAGWSFGGVLARETACCLTAAGETVEVVVMLDTILPARPQDTDGSVAEELLLDRLDRFVAYFEQAYGVELDLPRAELAALPDRSRMRAVVDRLGQRVPAMGAGVRRHQYTSYDDGRAAEGLDPQPYPGRVVLLRAQRPHPLTTQLDPAYLRTDTALGWDSHCSDLEVVPVPGDHITMIDVPHVDAVADALSAALAPRTVRS